MAFSRVVGLVVLLTSALAADDSDLDGGPLHRAVQSGSSKPSLRHLTLARSSRLAARGFTPLHRSAEDGDGELTQLLLARGAGMGDATSADFVSRRGRAVDSRDHNDATALMLAAGGGHERIVEMLVEAGADLAASDEFGLSALHYAAEGGHCNTITMLLNLGADPDATDEGGKTPADVAARGGFQRPPAPRTHGPVA